MRTPGCGENTPKDEKKKEEKDRNPSPPITLKAWAKR